MHRSRGVVLKLSGLFALDAFAGGFVPTLRVRSLLAGDSDEGYANLHVFARTEKALVWA
jgi:hypothetical protein